MIKLICGPKGFGKTKIIIEQANSAVAGAKGHVVFVNDTKRYMYDLVREVRVIDTKDFQITGEEALIGFIKGIVAANSDTQYIFIDGAARIAGKPLEELAAFYYMLEKLANDNNMVITLTVSAQEEELPEFIAKYL